MQHCSAEENKLPTHAVGMDESQVRYAEQEEADITLHTLMPFI